jgi:hypothetical protein
MSLGNTMPAGARGKWDRSPFGYFEWIVTCTCGTKLSMTPTWRWDLTMADNLAAGDASAQRMADAGCWSCQHRTVSLT